MSPDRHQRPENIFVATQHVGFASALKLRQSTVGATNDEISFKASVSEV